MTFTCPRKNLGVTLTNKLDSWDPHFPSCPSLLSVRWRNFQSCKQKRTEFEFFITNEFSQCFKMTELMIKYLLQDFISITRFVICIIGTVIITMLMWDFVNDLVSFENLQLIYNQEILYIYIRKFLDKSRQFFDPFQKTKKFRFFLSRKKLSFLKFLFALANDRGDETTFYEPFSLLNSKKKKKRKTGEISGFMLRDKFRFILFAFLLSFAFELYKFREKFSSVTNIFYDGGHGNTDGGERRKKEGRKKNEDLSEHYDNFSLPFAVVVVAANVELVANSAACATAAVIDFSTNDWYSGFINWTRGKETNEWCKY